MGNTKKVIVIGAGAAGIAAASRLYENGITDVLVLEAEDRIGGRVHTLDVDGDVGFVEVGAQWVHGEKGNVVHELALPKNLLTISKIFTQMLFIQSSKQIIDKEISKAMLEILEQIKTEIDDNILEYKTSGDFFVTKLNAAFDNSPIEFSNDIKKQFTEWVHGYMKFVDGSDTWFDSSISTLTEYKECEGHSTISWKDNGYRIIFSILMEKARGVQNNIVTNTKVTKVTLIDDKVLIKCCDGEEYTAEHVILTLSLGVLKETFEQLLPAEVITDKKRNSIENLCIGTVDKLFLKFPVKWWPDDINDFNFLWTDSDRKAYEDEGLKWLTDLVSFSTADNSPSTLYTWVIGPAARTMESLDEILVKQQLTQLLRRFLGHLYNIPDPNWFHRSTWQNNCNFRGSYSFRGLNTDKANASAADLSIPFCNQKNIPVILFAGEASHPYHYSSVHGAIETGWREADRIISLVTSTK